MRTLIVDDNIGSRTILLKIMKKLSDCEESDGGQDAITTTLNFFCKYWMTGS
ncbi:MAG: hypothetical protein HQ517_09080 [SAR324 cluster bacterium]|nr:hypothetical protein [SAR324 cluster bacterium]